MGCSAAAVGVGRGANPGGGARRARPLLRLGAFPRSRLYRQRKPLLGLRGSTLGPHGDEAVRGALIALIALLKDSIYEQARFNIHFVDEQGRGALRFYSGLLHLAIAL
jgi:hypothetical protein